MNEVQGEGQLLAFPNKDAIELGPGSAYEAVTRTMVEDLAEDVKEIRGRIDAIFWLIAGSIVVEVAMRAIGAGQ